MSVAGASLLAPRPVGARQEAERWASSAGEVYEQYCAGCHGQNLEGGSAGSLADGEWTYGGDNEQILESIRRGRKDTPMIAFSDLLDEEQIHQLVGFIRMREAWGDFRPRPLVDPDGKVIESEEQSFRVEVVARDLWVPWALEFLPDGSLLVSDRQGQLRMVENGRLRPDPVSGTPTPWTAQDGGFFDVALHPHFAENGWVYLAYARPGPDNTSASQRAPGNTSMTIIVRGRVRGNRWVDEQVVFEAPASLYSERDMHYGSRLLFGGDGKLFYSIGDRGTKSAAQDLGSPLGKVHRVNDDGTVPPDNPFVGREGALPTIWTLGHRNPQGLSLDPVTGLLWESEHGPIGGDELNVLEPGRNYGWPVISEGIEPGTTETRAEGMEAPIVHWSPSIAPAGILFYGGDRYPGWKNDLFVTGLAGRALRRLRVSGRRVTHQEVVLADLGRVRDVATGPDGLLYVALERREGWELTRPLSLLLRLVPVE